MTKSAILAQKNFKFNEVVFKKGYHIGGYKKWSMKLRRNRGPGRRKE
jgi:hypothetical protein